MINRYEPGKACHAVEYTAHAALLARHSGQLSVGTVQDVGHHQQHNGYEVVDQAHRPAVVEAAAAEEYGTHGTDNHRPDGDGVGMDVELGKEYGAVIAEGTDDVQVEPVFRLCRLQRSPVFLVHFCCASHTRLMVSTTTWVCSRRPNVMRRHDSSPGSPMNLIL